MISLMFFHWSPNLATKTVNVFLKQNLIRNDIIRYHDMLRYWDWAVVPNHYSENKSPPKHSSGAPEQPNLDFSLK